MQSIFLICLVSLPAATPSVKVDPTDQPRRVRVSAILPDAVAKTLPKGEVKQDDGEKLLAFALVDADSGEAGPAVFGRYEHADGKLTFNPRHALLPGQKYRATLYLDNKKTVTADYTAPAQKPTPVTRIETVYPTTDTLPANQLKFYVYFSRPMRESKTIFDHIHVLDDKGKAVHDPWRRTELWSADNKRLTVWIHPGRIKKGVNLRDEIGPVLEPDRTYSLVIESKILDADGKPLEKTFTKKFKTTKAVRSFVLVEDWEVTAPKVGTRDAVVLSFPRPLDHALARRLVQIAGKDKKPLEGKVELGKDEKSLKFTPAAAWTDIEYQVLVDGRLEDLAGNTPDNLFDVDNQELQPKPKTQTLTFRPEKAK